MMLPRRVPLIVRKFARCYSSEPGQEILCEKRDGKALLILNRPKQLNAFSVNFMQQLRSTFEDIRKDNRVKLIILKSSSDKAFSAGGDLKGLYYDLESKEETPPVLNSITKCHHPALAMIASFEKPIVALVNGICLGGGNGLALLPRYSVLTERVMMSMPEVAIGHWTDAASSFYFGQLPNNLGMLMALCAYRFSAAELIDYGLKKHYTTSDRVIKLENDLLGLSDSRHEAVAELLDSYHIKPNVERKIDLEKVNSIFGGNSVEEIIKNLQADDTEWSRKLLRQMSSFSPMSMKISFYINRLSQRNRLKAIDCLDYDNTLCINFYADKQRRADFQQGIKSLFEKSRAKWTPNNIHSIDEQQIHSYFEPMHRVEQIAN